MCTVLLPPGVKPIAVNKYIIFFFSEIRKVLRDGNIDRRGGKIKACTILVENSIGKLPL